MKGIGSTVTTWIHRLTRIAAGAGQPRARRPRSASTQTDLGGSDQASRWFLVCSASSRCPTIVGVASLATGDCDERHKGQCSRNAGITSFAVAGSLWCAVPSCSSAVAQVRLWGRRRRTPRVVHGRACPSHPPEAPPPSIVLILTDDQRRTRVGDPSVLRGSAAGSDVRERIVSNPLCCPSRATILTGAYSHSTGVYTNQGRHLRRIPGVRRPLDDRDRLQDAGYRTALMASTQRVRGAVYPARLGPVVRA